MAAPVDISQFKEALIVLGSAALVIPVFHKLRLSPVLGYILIGMAAGPHGAGGLSEHVPWLSFFSIEKEGAISHAAEFGIVLLMFMIGLELSLERLLVMRRLVFGLGSFQLVASAGAIGAVTYIITQDTGLSFIVGLALAMSSTAIVTQVLSQTKQLGSHHGRASFAVLIFQDIAVIPVMFAVGVMGASLGGSIAVQLGSALLQAGAAILIVILAGRMLLRPLFRRVAATQSPELFMSACLLVILAISIVTALAGLSMALGALMAGLLLAETEYRRQIEYTIEPFKGLLVGVFLISAGMNVDLARILLDPLGILLASVGLIVVKALVVVAGGYLFRVPAPASLRAGLLLGPGSEFTFVIVALAVGSQVLPAETGAFVLIVAALTMALIPALHGVGRRVERLSIAPSPPHAASLIKPPGDDSHRVIIAGFGRVGRVVAELLRKHDIPFIAVDANVEAVAAARDQGFPVYFGDIRQPDFMRLCGIATARALVLTMDAPKAANVVVQAARGQRHDLVIIARARDGRHASELYRLGVTDAVPETIEASLQLAEVVLVDVGIATGPAIASIHEKRAELRDEIQAMAPEGGLRPPPRRRLREARSSVAPRKDGGADAQG
jgi:CPA2 family monovalent cation:H+ antiporter-2